MSEIKAKEYLLNGIFNLEKNFKPQISPMPQVSSAFFGMALEQLKSSLRELSEEWESELESLGLRVA